MNTRFVFFILGVISVCIGLLMILPLVFTLCYGDKDGLVFVYSVLIPVAVGGIICYIFRGEKGDITRQEAFVIVTFGWVIICVAGSLPYYFSGNFKGYVDCIFESVSGFTTTGATMLPKTEGLSHGILLWRSFTQWIGGMGVILLYIAIFPIIGGGGIQLYRTEFSGSILSDKLTPRIKETAKIIWKIYLVFTVAGLVLLMAGKMSFFDSLCHILSHLATGGFSTRTASVSAYNSGYLDAVLTLFMFIGGTNFFLHYQAFKGNFKAYFNDSEFKFYFTVVLASAVLIAINTCTTVYPNFLQSFRYAIFEVVSIITSTGSATADYQKWPYLSQFILISLMFIGACTGSAGGGIKCLRIIILLKAGYRELYRLVHPHAVIPIKLGKRNIPEDVVSSVFGYLSLFSVVFFVSVFIMQSLGLDFLTSFTAVASSFGNIGSAFGTLGPFDSYDNLPFLGKWVLTWCMFLGRLEIYAVFVLLLPEFWKK